MKLKNLRSYLDLLQKHHQLCTIKTPVSAYLEIAEIHRRVIAKGGPALLFQNVDQYTYPVTTNLFGTDERVNLAFGTEPLAFVQQATELLHTMMPPTLKKIWQHRNFFKNFKNLGTNQLAYAPITELKDPRFHIKRLPVITSWKTDGGPFVTLPLVYTEHPETHIPNLGMYRIQIYDEKTTGIHWQIHKGGGFHYAVAEERKEPLPLQLYIGGPPALILAAIAPLPENIPELLLAGLLGQQRLDVITKDQTKLIAEADFAFTGIVKPFERKPEGPFGDHYGYNSLQHDYPVFHIQNAYARKDAIYPATVVGKPQQEDYFIGNYLQTLLSPMFPIVMPAVKKLWSYGDTGFHSLASAIVKIRYPKEAFASGLRILGEGQLSLTKNLFLIDGDIDLKDIKKVLQYLLERCVPETDIFIFSNISQDTLDYTGPSVNEGSKMLWMGVGEPKRKLPQQFQNTPPVHAMQCQAFCPGVLIIETRAYQKDCTIPEALAKDPTLKDWPLIFIVDQNSNIKQSNEQFLWTTFTRFEPANDIYAANITTKRFHHILTAPIVIDCRKKPWHTEELIVDEQTAELVDKKWKSYEIPI